MFFSRTDIWIPQFGVEVELTVPYVSREKRQELEFVVMFNEQNKLWLRTDHYEGCWQCLALCTVVVQVFNDDAYDDELWSSNEYQLWFERYKYVNCMWFMCVCLQSRLPHETQRPLRNFPTSYECHGNRQVRLTVTLRTTTSTGSRSHCLRKCLSGETTASTVSHNIFSLILTRLNCMVAYLGYTLRTKTLFRGWPVMAHETHTRRRRKLKWKS